VILVHKTVMMLSTSESASISGTSHRGADNLV